jgi:probable DNA metabolism protein
MINYIYDGSFEGLLTCVYEAYYRRENPQGILPKEAPQLNMLDENIYIESNNEKYIRVSSSIIEKISPEALDYIYYAYLSEIEGSGKMILEYIRQGFKVGNSINNILTDDRVLTIHKLSRRVGGEQHRMLGLLRFKYLGEDIYYAQIEPDYNILSLIAPHFSRRMKDQKWIIHDVKRNIAAVYDLNAWVLTDLSLDKLPNINQEEEFYQVLWKQYFKSIAISERENLRLQMQHMPKKYWKHLIEK